MKIKKISVISTICAIGIFLLPLALLTNPTPQANADSQGASTTFVGATNLPAIVNVTTISNSLNIWIPLRSRSGLGLQWTFNSVTGNSALAGLVIYTSVDGTNVSTVPFCTWYASANLTTNVIVNTNWSELTLRGFNALVIQGVTNAGSGIITNQSLLANRPNL